MLSPVFWFGGKHYLVKELLPLIPGHTCYAELFGGGGWLLFKKEPSQVEIYNDIHEILVAFFRIIREKDLNPEQYKTFLHYCEWIPYSRKEYENCLDWRSETNFELKVAKWWFNIRMGFCGIDGASSWRQSPTKNLARTTKKHITNFEKIGNRLRDVQIECRNWLVLFEKLNRPDVFLYLDPPYLPSTRVAGGYVHDMDESQHEELINKLKNAKAKILLSGYPNKLYETLSLEYNWNRKEITTISRVTSHQSQTHHLRDRIEVLWYNYEPVSEFQKSLPLFS